MTAIALIDTLALLATLAAVAFLIRGWKKVPVDVAVVFALLLGIMTFRNVSNFFQAADITHALDPVEDNVEVFLPLLWAFYLYTIGQQLDKKVRADLNQSLAARNSELQSVVYIASHDLRSPLVNIRGFSRELAASCSELDTLLADPRPDDNTRRRIENILKTEIPESLNFIDAGAQSMDGIIEGLLKLSRAGNEEIYIRPLNVNHIVYSIRQTFSFQIEQKGMDFVIGDLPPCLGDENQVAQLFSNLIGNALKYLDETRPGRIEITGRQEDHRSVYCVRDNGIGIAPEHHEKIFGIFCRLHSDRSQPGEGLGLNIVARILERHNGSVRLESQPGQGAAFYVSLPKP